MMFEPLYEAVMKLTENETAMREMGINSDQAAQRVADINMSGLVDMVSKKQGLVKKEVTPETAFAPPVSPAVAVDIAETNKTLNTLTRVFERLKINSARGMTEGEVYQMIQRAISPQPQGASRVAPPQTQVTVQTLPQGTAHAHQGPAPVPGYNRPQPGPNECLFCHGMHRQWVCPELAALIANGEVHMNGSNRICYGPNGSGDEEMKLPLNGAKTKGEAVRLCLQWRAQDRARNPVVTVAAVRLDTGPSSEDEEDSESDQAVVEVREARSERDPPKRQAPWKPLIEQSAKVVKERIRKEEEFPKAKNNRPGNYPEVAEAPGRETYVEKRVVETRVEDITMENVPAVVDPNSRATKYQKSRSKKEQEAPADYAQRTERPKRMLQAVKDQADSKALTQSILTSKIEVKLMDLLGLCPDLSRSFFRSLSEEEFDAIVAERKPQKLTRKEKETVVTVKSISAGPTETIHFGDIVARVGSLRTLYSVACPTAWVQLGDVRVKAMFDSGAEINCISKGLADRAGLAIRQGVSISLVGVTGARARFKGVCLFVCLFVIPTRRRGLIL